MAADDKRGGETDRAGVGALFARFFRRAPRQARSRAAVGAMMTALEEQLGKAEHAEGWTLEALVDRAGVGIGSFYEYFSSKDSALGALVGEVTERNFRELLAVLDAALCDSLEDTARPLAEAVARTYLGSPRSTRLVVMAIARLGLDAPVVMARDRFAAELAVRLRHFYPDASEADLVETMRIHNDAVMGLVTGELVRSERPDVHLSARRILELCLALLQARFGAPHRRAGARIPAG